MRNQASTAFEISGATAVSAAVAGGVSPWLGLFVAGILSLGFGFRMGNG